MDVYVERASKEGRPSLREAGQRSAMASRRSGKQMRSTPGPQIGAAFPHKEGLGFSLELKAIPLEGRMVALPPDTDDSNSRSGK
jgi:hypothetical protein